MENSCCHRGAPLHLGSREDDCVRCGYHGMKFVRTYPVVERQHHRHTEQRHHWGVGQTDRGPPEDHPVVSQRSGPSQPCQHRYVHRCGRSLADLRVACPLVSSSVYRVGAGRNRRAGGKLRARDHLIKALLGADTRDRRHDVLLLLARRTSNSTIRTSSTLSSVASIKRSWRTRSSSRPSRLR